MRIIPTWILLFTLILNSCNQTNTLSEKEKKAIAESVRQTLNNYYNDIAKSGLTAEFNYLDSSAEFFWVPPGFNGPISFDSVRKILNQNALNYRTVKNTFDTLSITTLSNELASYTGRLHSIMIDTAGKTMEFSMVETGVLIKRKEGWKLLSGQTSVLGK